MTELEQLRAKRDDLNKRIAQLESMEPVTREVQQILRDLADGFDNNRTRIYSMNERCDRSSYQCYAYGTVTIDTKIELTHFDHGKIELRLEKEKHLCR